MEHFKVIKLNKRLHIVNQEGNSIYSPPDFIHLKNRDQLENLAIDLNEGRDYIEAVRSWETYVRPCKL